MKDPALRDELLRGAHEVFGVRLGTAPGAGLRQLRLGRPGLALFTDVEELELLAQLQRYLQDQVVLLERLDRAEARLSQLQQRTASLLPDIPEGSGLRAWRVERVDLGLISHLVGQALLVDGEVRLRREIPLADVVSTARVLERHAVRSVPIGAGELYGLKRGRVAVVVLANEPLAEIDRALVNSLCTWTARLLQEQEYLKSLDALRIQAEAAARARSMFLAHMSHELRTPLNGVSGIAELLSDTALDADQSALLATLRQSATWLREIVDAVLDLSKLESGSMTLERLAFSPRALVQACCQGVQPLVMAKSLSLRWEVEDAVPDWVEGDALRIRQALLNLISNAIKFTERGDVEIWVGLDPAGLCRIEVRDRGIGVPLDRREDIFEPFAQAEASTTRRFGGTGLGLPLVREFARLHGGEAGMASREGPGSLFWFTADLPRAQAPVVLDPASPSAPRGMRVLVVEDHPVNRMVICKMLESLGHRFRVAEDGQEALELLATDWDFDVVLMDNMMPRLDGPSAVARLTEMGGPQAELVFVAMTAAVTPEDHARYASVGMDLVLPKPVDRGSLVGILAQAFGRAQVRASAPAASCGGRQLG